jgi:DNA-directed RNA polymerase subunit RPC12/RpoP
VIVFSCAKCARQLQTKPEFAGKKVKCPHCGQEVVVPAAVSVEAATHTAGSPPAESAPVGIGHSAAPAPFPPQSAAAAHRETIAAEELSRLIQENKPVPSHEDCLIKGDVKWIDLKYEHKLSLRNCTFEGQVDATDSHFLKTLDLSGCTFEQGISFAGAYVDHLIAKKCKFLGPFDASEVRFDQSVDLTGCEFEKEIKFPGTRIAGSLVLTDAAMRGPEACFELVAIEGNLLAQGLQSHTKLVFTNASVRGRTDFSRSNSTGKPMPMHCTGGLFLDGATLSGEVILEEAELTGSLNLFKATILGDLLCNFIRLQKAPAVEGVGAASAPRRAIPRFRTMKSLEPLDYYASAGSARRPAIANLRNLKSSGRVQFASAHLEGDLDLQDASIQGSLSLDGIFVGRQEPEKDAPAEQASKTEEGSRPADDTWDVLALDLRVTDVNVVGADIRGSLRLDGAHLSGNLYLNGSRIDKTVGLGNTEIRQNMHFYYLPDLAARVGKLWISGANIGGELILCGIHVKGDLTLSSAVVKEQIRLSGDGPGGRITSKIDGSLNLFSTTATGGVWLNQIEIGRDLNIKAASIKGGLWAPEAAVVGKTDLSSADVTGGIDFSNAKLGAHLEVDTADADGQKRPEMPMVVDFSGVKVTGSVDFSGAQITHKLSLDRACIDGRLKFRFRAEPLTRIGPTSRPEDAAAALDLKACFAHVADFDDHHPTEPRHLLMDPSKLPVMDVLGFRFDDLIVPGDNYVGFLQQTEFGPVNYVRMEKWLSNQGESAQAEKVFLAKRDRANNWFWRFASKCFLLLAFRSYSWAFIGLLVIGITCWVFAKPDSVRPQPAAWGPMQSIRMACGIHFPGAPVSLLDQWEPSGAEVHWPWQFTPPFTVTYQDYAHFAWGVTYVLVLPMLGIGVLIKWARRREGEQAS